MRNIWLIFLIISTIVASCEKQFEIDEKDNFNQIVWVGLQIEDVKPLPENLWDYTKSMINRTKSDYEDFDLSESVIVSYENCIVQAIITPLTSVQKTYDETYHVYFEMDGYVSTFDMLFSSISISEEYSKYLFLTVDDSLIVSFEINNESGLIENINTGELSSTTTWYGRWKNCVAYTLDALIDEPVVGLICMAGGKICAPSIAVLCAIAAAEGYFQNPGSPY